MKTYEVVKAIAKALRKEFKGMQANSYGFCCRSDYDARHKYINHDDCVWPLVYKGGMNNDYDYESNTFRLGKVVYYNWTLTKFDLDEVTKVMNDVAQQFDYEIIKPLSTSTSIVLKLKEDE
jgi:hypothetical protein